MYTKILLTMKTKFMELDTITLIYKVLSKNIIISSLAKEELLKRNLDNIKIDDSILLLVINKLSIEELWTIKKENINNHFTELATIRLNQILDYYQNLNIEDFLKKKNQDKIKII